ncbi:MAG: ribonuclease P protein component [Saprospiraceae bacterium]|nr:ribonuclease P protein component [Saprospiraceae bacterium]
MTSDKPRSFSREECLKSRKVIGSLFKGGQSFLAYPFRVVWCEMEGGGEGPPVQLAISVPKRFFKTAVQRNRLKRRIREAYRLKKNDFYPLVQSACPDKQIGMMLMLVAKEETDYKTIEAGISKLLRKWKEQF